MTVDREHLEPLPCAWPRYRARVDDRIAATPLASTSFKSTWLVDVVLVFWDKRPPRRRSGGVGGGEMMVRVGHQWGKEGEEELLFEEANVDS